LNPGDGYGMRKYVQGVLAAANSAKAAGDATGAIKLHSDHVIVSAENAAKLLDEIEAQATAMLKTEKYTDAKAPAEALGKLATELRDGVDKDNNGSVDPVSGEGQVFSMYDHAQYIAAMVVVSGKVGLPTGQVSTEQAGAATPAGTHEVHPEATDKATQGAPAGTKAATPPAPAATKDAPVETQEALPATEAAASTQVAETIEGKAVTINMLDFEFDKPNIIIKAGTEVTWFNAGAGPRHSARADDDGFDTGLYKAKESKTIKFDKPGTFPYYCELHGAPGGQDMAGVITVVP
jgi:plastocyanin